MQSHRGMMLDQCLAKLYNKNLKRWYLLYSKQRLSLSACFLSVNNRLTKVYYCMLLIAGQLYDPHSEDWRRVPTSTPGRPRDFPQHLRGIDPVRTTVWLQHVVLGHEQRLRQERQQGQSVITHNSDVIGHMTSSFFYTLSYTSFCSKSEPRIDQMPFTRCRPTIVI